MPPPRCAISFSSPPHCAINIPRSSHLVVPSPFAWPPHSAIPLSQHSYLSVSFRFPLHPDIPQRRTLRCHIRFSTSNSCDSLSPYDNFNFEGAFLVKDDRVLKGPLGRSLRSFARTAHSIHGLAHSLRSLPRRTVEILDFVFTL